LFIERKENQLANDDDAILFREIENIFDATHAEDIDAIFWEAMSEDMERAVDSILKHHSLVTQMKEVSKTIRTLRSNARMLTKSRSGVDYDHLHTTFEIDRLLGTLEALNVEYMDLYKADCDYTAVFIHSLSHPQT
jgi:uncharacterized protein YeeX (DUF496 family)